MARPPTEDEVHAAFEVLERHFESLRAERTEPAFYTSHRLPPTCRTRDTFHEHVKRIPSARKDGRVWMVPVADYHAAMKHPAPTTAPAADDSPERLFARAGVRVGRG